MSLRIQNDHARFKDIVRGKIKQNLKHYIKKGELIGKQGNDKITIPVPRIDLPHFRYGDKQQGGVGQGEGEPGDPLPGQPQDGPGGPGQAGQDSGEHGLDVDVTMDELADMLGEELELPRIEPKGSKLVTNRIKYTGVNTVGPESLRHFKRTYKQALRRQIAMGTYDPKNPAIVPIRDDRRYRTWRIETKPQANAVIVYMMDVSGSMGEEQKEIVRIESFWLDAWLRRNYDGRHHDQLGVSIVRRHHRQGVPGRRLEHLSVPFLRRRQLVHRRHAPVHLAAQGPHPPRGQPVLVRPGGVAVWQRAVHQGPGREPRPSREGRAVRGERQRRHLRLHQRLPLGGPLMPMTPEEEAIDDASKRGAVRANFLFGIAIVVIVAAGFALFSLGVF
jgi:hypothetical protein